jgi:hypothetical protein
MSEQQEGRNPVLGAPGSNNYSGLIASLCTETSRSNSKKFQGPPEKEITDLCKQHEKLAYNVALRYREGRFISFALFVPRIGTSLEHSF